MESSDKRKFDAERDGGSPAGAPSPKRRVIGPSLPPSASVSAPPESQSNSGPDSDSDDDFGPSLPPSHGDSAPPVEQSMDNRSPLPKVPARKESQRDRWMLQPPDQGDWTSKIDPTQIKNRKFQTGRSARSATSRQVDSSWMESPEERMRRLGDEVMGVGAPPGDTNQHTPSSRAARAESMEEKIQQYNDRTGKSVRLESTADARKKDDDPSARAFDREKDMAVSSRISHAQRREMVKKTSDYGSRFTKGNFL